MRLQIAKVEISLEKAKVEKCGPPAEIGVAAKVFFAFLNTFEEVRKSHKVSAKLKKGIKNYYTLKIVCSNRVKILTNQFWVKCFV